eukprot:3749612-Heterocapsa_arctica.AAC.1
MGHAQEAHELMLERQGSFRPEDTLRFGRLLPRGPLFMGVYVDDLGVALRLPGEAHEAGHPQVYDDELKRVHAGYAAHGLHDHEGKR